MTWTKKIRVNPGSSIVAEYECPTHGRFELTVERDENGDPPTEALCQEPVASGWCACELPSPWRPSAVHGRVKLGELDQGKIAERPAGNHVLDTRPLADDPTPSGYEKWKNGQRAITRDENTARRRAKTGRGGKVFVG